MALPKGHSATSWTRERKVKTAEKFLSWKKNKGREGKDEGCKPERMEKKRELGGKEQRENQ